jgi:hypothetical protein
MSFCKSTGRLSFSDPRLKSCRCPQSPHGPQPWDDLERADLDGDTRYMPFRLTANFVDFIG